MTTASSASGSQDCSMKRTSAAAESPCVWAWRSPRLRDMLMEGHVWDGVKTRCVVFGGLPTRTTCAPASSILARSSGRSGLWSLVSSMMCQGTEAEPPRWRRANTARESPTCATSSFCPGRTRTIVAVVPLVLASTRGHARAWLAEAAWRPPCPLLFRWRPLSRGGTGSFSSPPPMACAVQASRNMCISSNACTPPSCHHSMEAPPGGSCGFWAGPPGGW
mmetsp:Transcript_49410/g.139427  ORF Transcript_49410/g.139427 Transcript_49410/m.139427 type:complete len:220 (-) Transcript_49410:762-1421(-)